MTCIVGVANNGKVTIGADSAGVSGLNIHTRKDKKIFKLNKELIIGYTSSFRMGQIIQYHFDKLTSPFHSGMEEHEWMVLKFIPTLRSLLKEHGYATINNNEESGGTMLVGVNDRLFTIFNDYQVAEFEDGYASVGCGDSYALGCLHYTQDKLNDTDRVIEALRAANHHSAGVCKPFIIYDNKDNKPLVVE